MSDTTSGVLATLRDTVASAKSVPMSASVMVNKADMLALIDRATQSLRQDLAEADSVLSTARQTTYDARAEAETLLHDARVQAEGLVANHVIVTHAQEIADATKAATQKEADELRREADAYVDGRIAELEAGLTKTLTQIRTMRARLSQRSGLDDDSDTHVLPRLASLPDK